MYKIKVVEFDKKTHVKQATLRKVESELLGKRYKFPIYESSVLEIFGKSILKIKEAFDNNGIIFYDAVQNLESDNGEFIEEVEEFSPESFVEIGKSQEFKNTKFYESGRLETMISKYDYKLEELIKEDLAIYLIHHEIDFMIMYPNLWRELQKQFNNPQIFIFLSISQSPQILPQINTQELWEDSYEFRILLWKKWEIEPLTLESLYQVLRFNIML